MIRQGRVEVRGADLDPATLGARAHAFMNAREPFGIASERPGRAVSGHTIPSLAWASLEDSQPGQSAL